MPSGSGNGLARHLKIPFEAEEALKIIKKGETARLDAGSLNGHFFFCAAGIGIDAAVIHEYAAVGQRGFGAYVRATLRHLFSYKAGKYRVHVNGQEEMQLSAFMLSFANSSQFGNNFTIAPGAQPDDGQLYLSVLLPFPWWAVPRLAARFFNGTIDKSEYSRVFPFKKLRVLDHPHNLVHVDGEALSLAGNWK